MCTIQNRSTMNNTLSWKDKLTSSLSESNPKKDPNVRNPYHNKVSASGAVQERRRRVVAKKGAHPSSQQAVAKKGAHPSSQQAHTLHSNWGMYYHNPTANDWSIGSYMHIGSFRTIDDFSAYYKALEFEHNSQGMFFLMRGNIKPTWEDPHNIKGGCWSFKISLEHFFSVWKHLTMLMIGESLSTIPLIVNGISVSPKRGFCIIKIWNHTSSNNQTNLLRVSGVEYLEENGPALYTSFDNKK